jgi:hypothetical protein
MAHRLVRASFATVVVATVLSGCALIREVGGGVRGTETEHRQADAALARWAAAVKVGGGGQGFVPVGELTGQIGDWELAVGDNNKPALMAGMVVAAGMLPADAPGEALVRWETGVTKSIRPISATQALAELRSTALSTCAECVPLKVTAAHLSTASIQTSRGPATAPAWEFTLEGTSVIATRIAVAAADGITVEPPPWDANDPPTGISIDSARGTTTGTTLTVGFIGAPDRGDKPCGADYTAEGVESETAVVVIVVSHEQAFGGACNLAGALRTAIVELARPLGDRAVLEVKEGLPVPVTLGP